MIKTGIIGCGYWGPKLARNLDEMPDADLQWVCDLRDDRLEHMQELYPNTRCTKDYRQVLESDVDAVVIATPISSHYRLAHEALTAGKHVLVEKPITASAVESEQLVAEADRLKRVLMVGHTFEYNPAVVAVKKIVSSGELGDIYYINATRVNLGLFQPDINVVWDLAPHDVSILLYVLGMVPETASARGNVYVQRDKGIHDVAYLSLFFPTGVMADIRVSWLDPCKIRRYTIVGSEKMLVYDDTVPDDKIMLYDKGVDIPPYSDTEEEFHLSYRQGDGVVYPLHWEEPLRKECQHLVDCIRQNKEPRSSGRVGLQVVQVLEAAQKSLLNGGQREPV